MNILIAPNGSYSIRLNVENDSIICLRLLNYTTQIEIYQTNEQNINCLINRNGEGWEENKIRKLDIFPESNYFVSNFVVENNMKCIYIVNKGNECNLKLEFTENPSFGYFNNTSTSGFL